MHLQGMSKSNRGWIWLPIGRPHEAGLTEAPAYMAPRRFTVADRCWQAAYRLAYPLARLWWAVRHPRHRGALVCIRVGAQVLLVRQSYRRAWTLPGGGVRPAETPEAAARRELLEELGLSIPALHPATILHGTWEGQRDEVHVFELALDRLPPLCLDNREVVDARLFAPADLPGLRLAGPVSDYLAACGNGQARRPPGTAE